MPTCVGFGTGRIGIIARSFSRNPESAASLLGLPFAPLRASALCRRDLPPRRLLRLDRNPLSGLACPYSSLLRSLCGYRNIYLSSIGCAFGLASGPDLPRADEPSPGNLGLSVCRIPTCISLLTPAFSLPCSPPLLTVRLLRARNAPLPLALQCESAASAACLAPVHFRRRATRLVSCYALFKGWLLLSQPPSCLCISTSFSTQHAFWGLGWRSGLFPS